MICLRNLIKENIFYFIFVTSFLFLSACSKEERTNILVPDGSPSFSVMDFREPISLDPISDGWRHRTFRNTPPMDISYLTKDGRPSIRLGTNASASMLFRNVDIELDTYPNLSWDWFIEKGITSDISELTSDGDDHPARLYLGFESLDGDTHSMEIIWGNRELHRGDWKDLSFLYFFSFPHYVANSGDENIGRWHHQQEDLTKLYSKIWGDPSGVRLVEIALFCDTDGTDGETVAYFSNIRAEMTAPIS